MSNLSFRSFRYLSLSFLCLAAFAPVGFAQENELQIVLKPDSSFMDGYRGLGADRFKGLIEFGSKEQWEDYARGAIEFSRGKMGPNDVMYEPSILGLGYAYYRLDRYPEAVEAYKRAVALKPDIPSLYFNLSLAQYLAGHKEDALETLKKAGRDPAYSRRTSYRGLLALFTFDVADMGGRRAEAYAAAREYLSIFPQAGSKASQTLRKFVSDYEKVYPNAPTAAPAGTPQPSAQPQPSTAVAAPSLAQDSSFNVGQKGLLWEAFNTALEMDEAAAGLSSDGLKEAASMMEDTWKETLGSAKDSLDILKTGGRTDLGGPYLVIGYTHYQLGHYSDAAEAYKKAVGYRDGNVPAAHYNLALAYYKLGRTADAQRELTQAARVRPQYASQPNYRALSALLGPTPPAVAPAAPAPASAAPAEPSKEVPLSVRDLDMPSQGIEGGLLRVDHFGALNGTLVAFARMTGRVNGADVDEQLKLPVDVKPCTVGLCLSYRYPALSSMRRLGLTETYEYLKYDPAPDDRAAWYPEAARTLIRETQQSLWKEKNPPADWLAERLNRLAQLLAHPPR